MCNCIQSPWLRVSYVECLRHHPLMRPTLMLIIMHVLMCAAAFHKFVVMIIIGRIKYDESVYFLFSPYPVTHSMRVRVCVCLPSRFDFSYHFSYANRIHSFGLCRQRQRCRRRYNDVHLPLRFNHKGGAIQKMQHSQLGEFKQQ